MSASPPSNKMPVPPTLTSYLPVLLVSVAQSAVPDDTSFSTQPESQVDYLSHEWREEDVWRSWRSMTRQKNAISNGMRLENASWRTWWKQRNKLKTISPETLNWYVSPSVICAICSNMRAGVHTATLRAIPLHAAGGQRLRANHAPLLVFGAHVSTN